MAVNPVAETLVLREQRCICLHHLAVATGQQSTVRVIARD
jgi:hypothetical protein